MARGVGSLDGSMLATHPLSAHQMREGELPCSGRTAHEGFTYTPTRSLDMMSSMSCEGLLSLYTFWLFLNMCTSWRYLSNR